MIRGDPGMLKTTIADGRQEGRDEALRDCLRNPNLRWAEPDGGRIRTCPGYVKRNGPA
jgi:hypothetical protein